MKTKYTIRNQHLQLPEKERLQANIHTRPFDVEGERNRLMIWLASLAIVFLLTGCWWDDDDDSEEYVILVYMAADNNLDSDVTYSLIQMKEGVLTSSGTVVIYLDREGKTPRLFRLSPDGEEIALKEYAEENSADASTMARVIKEAKELVPSKKFGLIIWGHSMAWVPKGYGEET